MTERVETAAVFNRIFCQPCSSHIRFKLFQIPGAFVKPQHVQSLGAKKLPVNSLREKIGLRVGLTYKINITPVGGKAENPARIKETGMLSMKFGNSYLLTGDKIRKFRSFHICLLRIPGP